MHTLPFKLWYNKIVNMLFKHSEPQFKSINFSCLQICKNLLNSLGKAVHILEWFGIAHSHYHNAKEIMLFQDKVTMIKWHLLVMSAGILLCSKGEFPSDICTIHTLYNNTATIDGLLHQSYTTQTVLQWTLATGTCIKNFTHNIWTILPQI
jgi:hypothetical protein